jgi:hypothetical protein
VRPPRSRHLRVLCLLLVTMYACEFLTSCRKRYFVFSFQRYPYYVSTLFYLASVATTIICSRIRLYYVSLSQTPTLFSFPRPLRGSATGRQHEGSSETGCAGKCHQLATALATMSDSTVRRPTLRYNLTRDYERPTINRCVFLFASHSTSKAADFAGTWLTQAQCLRGEEEFA